MNAPSELRPSHRTVGLSVSEVRPPKWQVNRSLYLLVGEPWEWVDKRGWSDGQWQEYVGAEGLRTFVAYLDADVAGYYELSRDEENAVEIAYFGLAPGFIGQGLGAVLLTDALERAWSWDADRVWVHTCTLDHPAALKNYEARGMSVYSLRTEDFHPGQ